MPRTLPLAAIAGLALVAAGCSGAPQGGGLTTGSILPALPSVGSLLPGSGSGQATSGVRVERVSGNLYRLYMTERIPDPIQRENYTLLRAAETAQEVGASHFMIVPVGGGDYRGPMSGSTENATLVRFISVPTGSEAPAGAIAASEIVHFFGPQFGRAAAPVQPAAAAAPVDRRDWPVAAPPDKHARR